MTSQRVTNLQSVLDARVLLAVEEVRRHALQLELFEQFLK